MLNEKQCPVFIFDGGEQNGAEREKKINHHSVGLDQILCLGRLSATHRTLLKY